MKLESREQKRGAVRKERSGEASRISENGDAKAGTIFRCLCIDMYRTVTMSYALVVTRCTICSVGKDCQSQETQASFSSDQGHRRH